MVYFKEILIILEENIELQLMIHPNDSESFTTVVRTKCLWQQHKIIYMTVELSKLCKRAFLGRIKQHVMTSGINT